MIGRLPSLFEDLDRSAGQLGDLAENIVIHPAIDQS